MIIFNITIIVAVISIHELGHVLGGKLIGCNEAKVVIFDSSQEGPYTEMVCSNTNNQNIAYLSSLATTTLFGLFFLTFEEKSQKNMFFIILGLGILLAGLDIVAVSGLEIMKYVFIFFGFGIVLFGEILVGLAYANHQ